MIIAAETRPLISSRTSSWMTLEEHVIDRSVEQESRITRESLEEMPKHMVEETHLQGTPRFPKRCLPALMHMVPTSGTIRKPSEGKRAGGLATAHSAHQ